MDARINARTLALHGPRPYSTYGGSSPSLRRSPKTRDPLLAGKNGQLPPASSSCSRSPSRSPSFTKRDRSKRNQSLDASISLSNYFTTNSPRRGSGNEIDALHRVAGSHSNTRSDNGAREDKFTYRRSAMMPVSNCTSTWKLIKQTRCLVNHDPIYGVYINKDGEIYTTSDSQKGGQVQCFDRNFNCIRSFYLKQYKNAKPFQPYQIQETPDGHLAIACTTSVTVWSKEGKLITEHGKNMFKYCKNIAVRSTGEIIATDSDGDCVKIISPGGQQITKLDCEIYCAAGVAVDSKDNIIVTDWKDRIRIFDADNQLIRSFGQKGHGDGEVDMVYGVCVDSEDNIVVSDMWNSRVSVYSNEGRFIGHIATSLSSGLQRPLLVAITRGSDQDDHRLAVVEFGASAVKLFSY